MIVVTGAAGFIGSNIVRQLNTEGHTDILSVDRLTNDGRWRNLRDLRFSDLIDKDDLFDWLDAAEDVQAIIHMGACSDTTERDEDYLLSNNYEYTKQLAVMAIQKNIRFIHASSAATYGLGEHGYNDAADIQYLRPLNMYGYSKQLFDLWASRHGLLDRIVCLKYFNVYGPWEFHKGGMRSVPLKAYEQILDRGFVQLFKSYRDDYDHGEQQRDFIYINDAVDMTLQFLNSKASGIFNVGTGIARTWNDLVHALFNAMGKEPEIEYIDMPPELRDQYQYFTCASTEKSQKHGLLKARYTLEDGISDYVRFLAERPL